MENDEDVLQAIDDLEAEGEEILRSVEVARQAYYSGKMPEEEARLLAKNMIRRETQRVIKLDAMLRVLVDVN